MKVHRVILAFLLIVAGCSPKHRDNHQGELIFLLGTSTSGKTTLINKIKKIRPDIEDCGLDDLELIKFADEIKRMFPKQYADLIAVVPHEKVGNLVERDDYLIHTAKVPQKIKDRALDSAQYLQLKKYKEGVFSSVDTYFELILHDMAEKLDKGETLIADGQNPKIIDRMRAKFPKAKIKVCLIFCSMDQLSKRLTLRNRKAREKIENTEMRLGFPLWQYAGLFKKKESNHDIILETLARTDAENAFDAHLAGGIIQSMEKIQDVLSKLGCEKDDKATFLKVLGFTSKSIQSVAMTTRYKGYDMIVDNTKEGNAEIDNAAQSLLSFLEKNH